MCHWSTPHKAPSASVSPGLVNLLWADVSCTLYWIFVWSAGKGGAHTRLWFP
jgi:hypothetical protein